MGRRAYRAIASWIAILLFAGGSAAGAATPLPTGLACLVGAWRAPDGVAFAVSRIADRGDALRVGRLDGRSGVFVAGAAGTLTAAPDPENAEALSGTIGGARCDAPTLRVQIGDAAGTWTRIPLVVTRTSFRSGDVTLAGQLVEPPAGNTKPSLFVQVHGSEATAAIDHSGLALLMASEGIAAFVYDKRGTGASGGVYTQDFDVLSDDAARAVVEARRLSGNRVAAVGLAGFSQGGWVAPAAAVKAAVDFVVVGYGVAGTPLEQDEWQVAYQLRAAGFGDVALADARTVTDLTARVAASDFRDHRGTIDQVETAFGHAPWYRRINGQYSGLVLQRRFPQAQQESPEVSWTYDWRGWLERVDVPQLWVLAAEDSVAPSGPTLARLQDLKRAGRAIEVVVFPATDHGIRTYRTLPDGTRRTSRSADGYLSLLANWMRARRVVLTAR